MISHLLIRHPLSRLLRQIRHDILIEALQIRNEPQMAHLYLCHILYWGDDDNIDTFAHHIHCTNKVAFLSPSVSCELILILTYNRRLEIKKWRNHPRDIWIFNSNSERKPVSNRLLLLLFKLYGLSMPNLHTPILINFIRSAKDCV